MAREKQKALNTRSEYKRNWYLKNRDKCLERAKQYRETHKKEIQEAYQNNRDSLVEVMKQNHRSRRARKPWWYTLRAIKQRCDCKNNSNYKYYGGKGIKCLLTEEDLKYLWHRDNAHLMRKPSIDRINASKDYTLDNCRYIELEENVRRKHEYSKVS